MNTVFEGLSGRFLGTPVWLWLGFVAVVLVLLALDLGVLHRKERDIGVRESVLLSAAYIGVAVLFGLGVGSVLGAQAATEFFTGFFIEKSLSMDNVFVMALIFSFFAIPRGLQHRVLFWGILGVIVLRAVLIGLGAALVHQFAWVMYVFGAFLLFTGVKMLCMSGQMPDLAHNPVLAWLRRHLRVTPTLAGRAFFVRRPDPATGRPVWWATPLFLALCLVELADVVFAVDSVPAIFAISTDPFIVYTSNIFAILGLRALYFALAAMVHRFAYLKYALAGVLVFVGGKILGADLLGKTPAWVSLSVTLGLLAGGVLVSLWKTRAQPPGASDAG